MINILILHCPACYGTLNIPITLTSTLFKTYEISTNYNYAYGSNLKGQINSNNLSLSLIRNFKRFSLISVFPYYYIKTTGSLEDQISSLHGIDIGIRFFPVYAKFSKYRTVISILTSYKLPIGFYIRNNQYEKIVDYLSFGSGYAFVYNKFINYGEIIYSKALKDNDIQSDRARTISGFYYAFNKYEIGPVLNWVYQKALNSNEITLGISLGLNVFNINTNLNVHKSVYYRGSGIENDFLFEIVLRGGF
ncbi:MAG: hypothetical protein ABIL72_02790 [candidate division WOR-3 bacterium]